MNLIYRMILLAAAISLLSACSAGDDRDSEGVVSVSIMPVGYFVDRMTDSQLEVNVMVPPGTSHATYSPTTGQMRRLSESGIYFRVGHLGYEMAFAGRLSEINPGMLVVDLSEGVDLIRGEPIDHGDHVHEGGIDPHVWMSPAAVLSFLPVIKDALAGKYPGLEQLIENRYKELYDDVMRLHIELEEVAEGQKEKKFMIFHPALTYLARDYGYEQIPIERDGREPSPSMLRDVISRSRDEGVPLIFIQEEFDIRSARLVSEETGARLVQIRPLDYDWVAGMEEIIEVLKELK